eukprot:28881_6
MCEQAMSTAYVCMYVYMIYIYIYIHIAPLEYGGIVGSGRQRAQSYLFQAKPWSMCRMRILYIPPLL